MANIHPTALISPQADIASSAEIGPYCTIGPNVVLAENVKLISHVVVDGITSIGAGTVVFPFASLGQRPQDLKYRGEPSRLEIGENNQIREGVTIHTGTEGGGMLTKIGNSGLFMAGAHIAHDCQVGDNVILVGHGTLGGHVHLGDFAIIGGLSAVHQFVRIGQHVMVGGMTGVETDVIPYGIVTGNRASLSGLNLTGLKRRGFSRPDIHALRNAYKVLFGGEGSFAERITKVADEYADCTPVMEIITFLKADTSRSICQPKTVNDLD